MDANYQNQPERLEDQLRRMILTNPSTSPSTNPTTNGDHPHPIVRLPPPPQQQPGFRHQEHFGSPAHGPVHSTPQHPGSFGPDHGNGSSMGFPPGVGGYGNAIQEQSRDWRSSMPPRGGFQHQHGNRGRGHYGPRGFHQGQRGGPSFAGAQFGPMSPSQRARNQQHLPIDPNAFQRDGPGPGFQGHPGPRPLFNPSQGPMQMGMMNPEYRARQSGYLENLAASQIRETEMGQEEHDEKQAFRVSLQKVLRDACASDPEHLPDVSLECFGSFQSGFATKGSDMDLVIVVKDDSLSSACFSLMENDLPRVLEKRLLALGYGARLLSRTRVPIIKVCEKPSSTLLNGLREEREKWEQLPDQEKYPELYPKQDADVDAQAEDAGDQTEVATPQQTQPPEGQSMPTPDAQRANPRTNPDTESREEITATAAQGPEETPSASVEGGEMTTPAGKSGANKNAGANRDHAKPWTRERKAGPLDFPKEGVGIQSDINFFNPLGLHNTQMLRCYSLCDPRVRPMVLFVKAWAKRRKINSSYSGTLSSYGYVLMVLHYLVNVADPPVLPNLQGSWRPQGDYTPATTEPEEINGWAVGFWRNEDEIRSAAQQGQLTTNHETLGSLLAGFFQYYSSQGGGYQFRWMLQILSLRSPNGILSKEEKGWVKAVTEENEGRKVQQRYLFCIEDPFELNHNVARTVTHNGIVAIRDEFRRARRILHSIGNGQVPRDGELFAHLLEAEDFEIATAQMKHALGQNARNLHHTEHNGTLAPQFPYNPSRYGPAHAQNVRSIDLQDDAAFPSLGAAPSGNNNARGGPNFRRGRGGPRGAGRGRGRGGRGGSQQTSSQGPPSEISGEDVASQVDGNGIMRNKDEAQAESTAFGAAAAVLGDFD